MSEQMKKEKKETAKKGPNPDQGLDDLELLDRLIDEKISAWLKQYAWALGDGSRLHPGARKGLKDVMRGLALGD